MMEADPTTDDCSSTSTLKVPFSPHTYFDFERDNSDDLERMKFQAALDKRYVTRRRFWTCIVLLCVVFLALLYYVYGEAQEAWNYAFDTREKLYTLENVLRGRGIRLPID